MSGTGRLIAAVVGMLLGPALVAADHRITFHLVPEARWNDGQPEPDAFLGEGEVRLYRLGSYEPALTVAANRPASIPAGEWTWIAEAPGWVSVVSGVLRLPQQPAVEKTLIWPLAPACAIELSGRWQGAARLDVVSLDRGATYPVKVRDQARLQVPAGRFLAYTVGPRGVDAISAIQRCSNGAAYPLERPPPPPANLQDVMVSVRLPADLEGSRDGLEASLEPLVGSPAPPIAPTAMVSSQHWATFFYLGVPAEQARQLTVRHPALLTELLELTPLAGGVRELEDIEMVPRIALELPVDYRPLRAHREARLVLRACGRASRRAPANCAPAAPAVDLVPGLTTYSFAGLDVGRYVAEVRIDGERLYGLGSGKALVLDRSDAPTAYVPAERLHERHIYGHLLVAGEPVPGEARIEPTIGGRFPSRRFPTDGDLLYHLYYFGQRPPELMVEGFPADLRRRQEAGGLEGLPLGSAVLRACDDGGFCKPFQVWSTFTGDGRFDIDLGDGGRWLITVVDDTTGEPVPDALVLIQPAAADRAAIHVFDDRTVPIARPGGEALHAASDGAGEVRLRGLAAGPRRMLVRAEGYREQSRQHVLGTADLSETRIALEPKADEGGWVVRFTDGEPSAHASVLGLRDHGGPDYRCAAVADGAGNVRLPPACFLSSGQRIVVFHSQALARPQATVALRAGGEIWIERRSGLPLRVRLRDPAGEPLVGLAVALRFDDFVLEPDHLLAAGRAGRRFAHTTDSAGEIVFGFVGLEGSSLPELGVGGRWYPLPPAAGTVIELTVE